MVILRTPLKNYASRKGRDSAQDIALTTCLDFRPNVAEGNRR